jgi:cell division protein FtsN
VNKILVMVGVLALGALGLAFVFRSQSQNAKTVMLQPSKVSKTAKPTHKNSSVKSAGSLEDLTKDAPEPRAVTTDAVVVAPKPASSVTTTPEAASPSEKPVRQSSSVANKTPVKVTATPTEVAKPVPEISKPVEKPQISATIEKPQVSTTIEKSRTSSAEEKPTPSKEPSSLAVEKPVTNETTSSDSTPTVTPTLPLRRSPGSVSIQAGAFKNADNAEGLRAQLVSQGFKVSVEVGEDGISRVIVGPYPNEETAREAANRISSR